MMSLQMFAVMFFVFCVITACALCTAACFDVRDGQYGTALYTLIIAVALVLVMLLGECAYINSLLQ